MNFCCYYLLYRKQVLPKVIWEELVATPRRRMHSTTTCASCSLYNVTEALHIIMGRSRTLQKRYGVLWTIAEHYRVLCDVMESYKMLQEHYKGLVERYRTVTEKIDFAHH